MRYSILGFNQEKLMQVQTAELKLNMQDVLIMNYIQMALAQPSMIKIMEEGQPYVWLNHSKILEDLPILNIKENMLSKHLSKLIKLNLIASKTIASEYGKGSRTYYTITELLESLQFCDNYDTTASKKLQVETATTSNKLQVEDTTTSNKLQVEPLPQVINYRSYNKLNKDNKLDKDKKLNIFNFGQPKSKSQNLYSKCLSHIYAFSSNLEVQKNLKDFLDSLNEMKKLRGEKQFVGILNKLNNLSLQPKEQIAIIQYSLEHGYATFYDCKKSNNYYSKGRTGNAVIDLENLDPTQMRRATEEEKRQFQEDIKNGKAEKF